MADDAPLAHYPFPRWQALALGLDLLVLGRRRSFAAEGARALRALPLQPRVEGLERLPARGPLLLVMNHYERPGLWTFWSTFLTSHAVRQRRGPLAEVHWLITAETRGTRYGPLPVPGALMQWVIGRIAQGYGLITLPVAPEATAARATALRSALRALRSGDERSHIIGLAPEGAGGRVLREALPGTGEFLLLAARTGAAIVPVGIAERPEHDWALTATLGAPLNLTPPQNITRAARDQWARTEVMQSIARLLPRDAQGFYHDALPQSGQGHPPIL